MDKKQVTSMLIQEDYEDLLVDFRLACTLAGRSKGKERQAYMNLRKILKESLKYYDKYHKKDVAHLHDTAYSNNIA